MEKSFFAVSTEVAKLERGFEIKDLSPILTAWEKHLQKCSNVIIRNFIDSYYEELRRAYYILKKQQHLRGFIDRIYKNILKMDLRMPLRVTNIFAEFIKGITYFSNQQTDSIPVYHRLMSCGDGTDAFRKSYNQCNLTMKKSVRQDVEGRIYTCYLERLIYDHLYRSNALLFPEVGKEPSVQQDTGHVHWLEETKKDYESCFPNEKITIAIDYHPTNTLFPLVLKITRTFPKFVRIETYTKRLIETQGLIHYEDIVEAERQEGSKIWFKISRFAFPTRWKRVQFATPTQSQPEPFSKVDIKARFEG